MGSPINVSDLLAYGEQQVGKPYVFGGAGPNTFDCSGLIQYMYKHFGMDLPHHAADQARLGTAVPASKITAGDLVFSDWGDGPNSHVGIATDATHILVAPHTGETVQVEPLTANYRNHITAVRRVGNLVTSGGTATGIPPVEGPTGGIPIPRGGGGTPTGGTSPTGPTGGTSGPTSSSNGNVLDAFWDGLMISTGGIFSGAYKEIAKPLQDVGDAFMEIAAVADKIFSIFLPSNFIRLASGVAGVACILIGVLFLRHELKGA